MHWGSSGPDRWVISSPRTVTALFLQHAVLCLLLIASALGVLHWSRRICTSGPSAVSERRFRRRAVVLILSVEYLSILPLIFGLLEAPALAMQVWSVTLLITVLGFLISLMHAGQGGARLTKASGHPIGDRTPDARWIAGIIYFNGADPSVLVQRRMGIGWTLNFGNPWSWVSLLAAAVLIVIGPHMMQSISYSAAATALEGPPTPGTEDSLRRYILSLEEGHPNYEEMSPRLAASVKQQLPKIKALITRLGEFESLTYEGADADGSDVYAAAFAHGQLQWHIGPLVDGKVTRRYARPIS
jgi:hypothetical protein